MSIDNINDIPLVEDVIKYCEGKVLPFFKAVLPSRTPFLAHENYPVSTTPYITFRFIGQRGDNEGINGNGPILKEVGTDGSTTSVYEYVNVFEVRTFKDNAFGDLNKLKQSLKNSRIWYEYFGKVPEIGVRITSTVSNTPTPIDGQEWEAGATMNITISCLAKELDAGMGYISSVGVKTKTLKEDRSVIEEDSQVIQYP